MFDFSRKKTKTMVSRVIVFLLALAMVIGLLASFI